MHSRITLGWRRAAMAAPRRSLCSFGQGASRDLRHPRQEAVCLMRRISPRRSIRVKAQGELGECVCRIVRELGLTNAEVWYVLSEESRMWAGYALIDERKAADSSEEAP